MAIGRVTFDLRGAPATATLRDDGRWSAPDRAIARTLNSLAGPGRYGPADGDPAVRALIEAAGLLGGTAEIEPREPGPPGRIY